MPVPSFKDGKILAIDNLSGHFKPGFQLLAQAVERIRDESAFTVNSLVGLHFKATGPDPKTIQSRATAMVDSVMYLPVEMFVDLAGHRFAQDPTRKAIARLEKMFPNGPGEHPYSSLGLFGKMTWRWKDNYITWKKFGAEFLDHCAEL